MDWRSCSEKNFALISSPNGLIHNVQACWQILEGASKMLTDGWHLQLEKTFGCNKQTPSVQTKPEAQEGTLDLACQAELERDGKYRPISPSTLSLTAVSLVVMQSSEESLLLH